MDQYKILKKLGNGKQGIVFKGVDKKGKEVAMKQIFCSDSNEIKKVQEEVNLIKKLEHQNMVQYYDCFETTQYDNFTKLEQKYVWIVMEFCNGSLEHYLHGRKEPVPIKTFKIWLEQMLDALLYLHSKKIFHRDIKPENILFLKTNNPTGEDWVVKLCDFGFTKHENDSQGSMVGTLSYMAPEVGIQTNYDSKADIFSIGVLCYQMATLKPPNRLENVSFHLEKDPEYLHKVLRNYDPIISRIIFKSTCIDPKKRATSDHLMKILLKDKDNSKFLESKTEIRILCDLKGIMININELAEQKLGIKKYLGQSVNVLAPKEYTLYKDTYITELTQEKDMIIQKSDGSTLPLRVVPHRDELFRVSLIEIPYKDETKYDGFIDEELKKIDELYDNLMVDEVYTFQRLGKRFLDYRELSDKYELLLAILKELKLKSESLKYSIEIEKLKITLKSHTKYHEFIKFLGNDLESVNLCKFYHECENYKKIPSSNYMKRIHQHYFTKKRIPLLAPIMPKNATYEAFDSSQYECLNLLRFQYKKFEQIRPELTPSDFEKSTDSLKTEGTDRTSTDFTDLTDLTAEIKEVDSSEEDFPESTNKF